MNILSTNKNLEAVSHPSHYQGKYETIDVIEAQGWGAGFNKGNALKYILRAGRKDASKEIEDLEKARWYIDREISRLKAEAAPKVTPEKIKAAYASQNWPTFEEINSLFPHENERIWENGKEVK